MKLWALALFLLMGCNSAGGGSGLPLKVGDRFVTFWGDAYDCDKEAHVVEEVSGTWVRVAHDNLEVWIQPPADTRSRRVIICPK